MTVILKHTVILFKTKLLVPYYAQSSVNKSEEIDQENVHDDIFGGGLFGEPPAQGGDSTGLRTV